MKKKKSKLHGKGRRSIVTGGPPWGSRGELMSALAKNLGKTKNKY